MTDREKLVKLVHTAIAEWEDGEVDEKIADHLISNGVTFQKWIPVTERLPDEETSVLLARSYRGKRYVDIGTIKEGMAYCYSDEYKINLGEHKLTHWMPLPKPPKENCQ